MGTPDENHAAGFVDRTRKSYLDDAVAAAKTLFCNPERLGTMDPPMDADEQNQIG